MPKLKLAQSACFCFGIMQVMIAHRILYNIFIFFAVALLVWPIYTALIIAGVFLFKNFFESIAWIVIIEILFAPVGIGLLGHWYALVFIALVLVAAYSKQVMRWYE